MAPQANKRFKHALVRGVVWTLEMNVITVANYSRLAVRNAQKGMVARKKKKRREKEKGHREGGNERGEKRRRRERERERQIKKRKRKILAKYFTAFIY